MKVEIYIVEIDVATVKVKSSQKNTYYTYRYLKILLKYQYISEYMSIFEQGQDGSQQRTVLDFVDGIFKPIGVFLLRKINPYMS